MRVEAEYVEKIMDECKDFLSSLHRKGVKLWCDEDGLHYQARRGVLSAKEIETLRIMKNEVVEVLQNRRSVAVDSALLMQRASPRRAPLTVQQESVWLAIQRGKLSYLHPRALRISGCLNCELLRKCLEEVVRRHDSLRTRMTVLDSIPNQQIDEPGEYHLRTMDLSGASDIEVSGKVQDLVEEVSKQGGDIGPGSLFEVRLLKLSEDEYLFIWSIHHIVSDGFSASLVFRELWSLYGELSRGHPSPLKDGPMQYADYAIWQEKAREKHKSYWSARLLGATGIQWPVDGSSSECQPDSSRWIQVSIGQALSDRLRSVASSMGATVGMVVLSIYMMAVSRWCNQEDITVAITVTGRDRPELESMTGYCAHILFLRIQLDRNDRFSHLLSRVTQEFYCALTHQDFGRAVASAPELFSDTLFQWMPWEENEYNGVPTADVSSNLDITVEPSPIKFELKREGPFSSYKAVTSFTNTADGIVGSISGRVFLSANARERFANSLRSIAELVGKDPHRSTV